MTQQSGAAASATAPAIARGAAARLVSLDVFRGLTMAAMVIVNNPGDWDNVYAPLEHAQWNGWTPTDLIFPFFLFIVGVSVTLSRSTMGSAGRIVRRALVIWGLGLFMAAFPYFNLATVRIPGVLARISWCYVAAAFIFRGTAPKGGGEDGSRRQATMLLVWAAVLTIGYWLVMTFVPAPGGVAGDLTPAGNIGAWLDRTVFGAHLWKTSKVWDPEGLLSSVPAVATTLLGAVAGLWLRTADTPARKALGLMLAGIVAAAIGQLWNLAFPINKSLWTSSYVWFTAGGAAILLSLCVWLIDVWGWKAWSKPFVILGLNAISLFVLSGLFAKSLGLIRIAGENGKQVALSAWLYRSWFAPLAAPRNASLLYAMTHLVLLFGVLYLLYRRKVFLKA
jgi:predicted acyltransferase